MQRLRIPHDDVNLAPGTWRMVECQPVFRCPECKTAFAMINHTIDPSGDVVPSMGCVDPCAFCGYGLLEGWRFGWKRAGERVHITRG